jgi:Fe-S-cluster-containing hydrogenase component 2
MHKSINSFSVVVVYPWVEFFAAKWQLCVGCGARFSICPERKIRQLVIENDGICSVRSENDQSGNVQPCEHCRICLDVCSGIYVFAPDHQPVNKKAGKPDLKWWGAFSQVWEGYGKTKHTGASIGRNLLVEPVPAIRRHRPVTVYTSWKQHPINPYLSENHAMSSAFGWHKT